MTYSDVLAHLDALQMHKIKLGLGAMRTFLEKVGHPEDQLKFVHLAGTNGKGSVCAALSEILERAGYRAGVYTSPHLSCVRERFRIGKEYISEAAFARLGTRICEVLGEDQITYFEFTTALGLLWFAEEDVDLVVLETGMGGRLDATNVVTPLVSVITSVSMDHEAYLGTSLKQIAAEKAGIIKDNIPVVSAATAPEAAAVMAQVSEARKAPLYVLGRDFDYLEGDDGTWGWRGTEGFTTRSIMGLRSNNPNLVQRENQSLAIAVLMLLENSDIEVGEDHIREGLTAVTWPGRMEYLELGDPGSSGGGRTQPKTLRYLLDGAHNPAGIKNLVDTLASGHFRGDFQGRIIAIWGSMYDKDLSTTMQMIVPLIDHLILTQPDGERAAIPEQLFELLSTAEQEKAQCIAGVEDALNAARKMSGENDLILIGGSLYLIGAIRYLLMGELV